MIEDSQTPEAEPKMRERGPINGLTEVESLRESLEEWRLNFAAQARSHAALLAQRDRYEAALRLIAASPWRFDESGKIVPGLDFVAVAQEALAAAQPIGDDWPPDCVDGTDNSGAVGGAAAQEGE
jgi:hypothetical protein